MNIKEKNEPKKDKSFFSHDSATRRDPRIKRMLKKYGRDGYSIFFMLLEDMREAEDYKLLFENIDVYAYDYLQIQEEWLRNFIDDCIKIFKLFESDEKYFYSSSFLRRMGFMEEKKKKKSVAGKLGAKKKHEKQVKKTEFIKYSNLTPKQEENQAVVPTISE